MSDGERMVESLTAVTGMKRKDLEVGYDFPADETLGFGFSAGSARLKQRSCAATRLSAVR